MAKAKVLKFDAAGPGNITDLYLLRLATACDGRLVTFDGTIRWQRVVGCTEEDLEIIGSPT